MIDVATETLLTCAQAARRLGKHPDTIRNWIREERLEGIDLAGRLHTSVEAIARITTPVSARRDLQTPKQKMTAEERAEVEAIETLRAYGIGE